MTGPSRPRGVTRLRALSFTAIAVVALSACGERGSAGGASGSGKSEPSTTRASLPGSGTSSSGTVGAVSGRVLTAPTCPVERADSACPPRPVPNAVVTVRSRTRRVATTKSDAAGRFTLRLPVGSYVLSVADPYRLSSTARRTIDVGGQPVHADLVIDSGIR